MTNVKPLAARVIKISILTVLVGVFAWYLLQNLATFSQISITSPAYLVNAAVLVLLNIFAIGMVMEIAMEAHGTNLSKYEIFGLSSITRFANQIGPGFSGATIRAVYFKKNHNVSFHKFTSSFLLSNILQFLISGLIALTILVMPTSDFLDRKLIFFVIFLLLVFTLVLFIPLKKLELFLAKRSAMTKSRLLTFLFSTISELMIVRSQKNLLSRSFVWMVITLVSTTLIFMNLYLSIGLEINFWDALFIAAFANWSILISLTPSNIGIREGLMVAAAKIMSVSIPQTIIVALIFRIVTLVISAITCAYFAPRLLGASILNLNKLDD